MLVIPFATTRPPGLEPCPSARPLELHHGTKGVFVGLLVPQQSTGVPPAPRCSNVPEGQILSLRRPSPTEHVPEPPFALAIFPRWNASLSQ